MKAVTVFVILSTWMTAAVAQSSDREVFLQAYPLCFELYPDEGTAAHKTCIELSARFASGYNRDQLAIAVGRHLDERERARGAEEHLRAQRSESASKPDSALEFKGIALGSEISTVENTGRFHCRDPKSPIADQLCSLKYNERETIAGVPVKVLLLYYYSGKLETISVAFDEKHFSQVSAALSEKYGQGNIQTEAVQNRMGATFENRTLSWRRGATSLQAKRYSGQLDQSVVMYRSDYALEEFLRRRKSSVKDSTKDL
jgi:hypothetical protein